MAAVIEQTWQQHRRGLEHRSCALPMPLPMAPPLEEAMGMAMAYKAAAAAVPLG
jgi:hypothetical protein